VNIDGDVAKNVYGGHVLLLSTVTADSPTLSANNNVVNFNAGTVLGMLYGGRIENGNAVSSTGAGNPLNVNGTGLTAKNIENFNTVNLSTSAGKIAGTTLLTLNGGTATDLSGTEINTTVNANSEFAVGDVVHLLANSTGITTDEKTNITAPTIQSAVAEYTGTTKMSTDGKSLDFTATSASLTEQSKSVAETRAATTTVLNSAADFLASAGITNAVDAAVMEAFGSAGGGSAAGAAGDASSDSDGNGESGSGSVGEAKTVRGGNFAPFAALGGSSLRANPALTSIRVAGVSMWASPVP
ncbi:MAG: hypothetical protein IJJ84_09780, partial [Kiritimatiellae bacterium]|nr:hypothetical protein [Kiritimatiellia bacterium]